MTHIFNLQRSPEEPNRQLFAVNPGETQVALPAIVDLRAKFPAPYNQKSLGACSSMALGAALQFLNPTYEPSQLFIYYNERKAANEVMQDSGSTLQIGVQTLNQYGACPESDWPYDISKFEIQPPVTCYQNARKDILVGYQSIPSNNIELIKTALYSQHPVVFGILIYPSFESEQTAQTGIVSLPAQNEQTLGGHALCFAGYDDSKNAFLVRNSWGVQWGQGGYFWLPYAYVQNPELTFDIWVISQLTTTS